MLLSGAEDAAIGLAQRRRRVGEYYLVIHLNGLNRLNRFEGGKS